jgi:hypothetical protein
MYLGYVSRFFLASLPVTKGAKNGDTYRKYMSPG